jgi:hypothetical protein
MGLWTPDQLEVFGTNAYYSFPLVAALKKLFLAIGTYLTETVIKIWQSRQTAECELAATHQKTPIPNYKQPTYLFNPINADLPSHSAMEMEVIVRSASEVAPVRAQKVNNSSSTKRKLKPRPAIVVAVAPQPDSLETNAVHVPSTVHVVLSDAVINSPRIVIPQNVVDHKLRFKQAKKAIKRKSLWTPEQKYVNAVAKKSYVHWRDKAKELPKAKAKTSVLSLLHIQAPQESPPRRQKQSKSNKGPRHPVQPTLKSLPMVEGGDKAGSSASMTALHSPVRGHDPSAICWHLSRISYRLVVFVFAVWHMIGLQN